MAFDWFLPVTSLKGIGSKLAENLAKLNIFTAGDLLLHCPYRYEDRTRITPIQDLLPSQFAVVQGDIMNVNVTSGGRKKRCHVLLADKTGTIELVFFHYYPKQVESWQVGKRLHCFGQVKGGKTLQIVHPEYEFISEKAITPVAEFLTPIYPTVAGLAQGWLRKIILQLLFSYVESYKQKQDTFAKMVSAWQPMLSWLEALQTIHQPQPHIDPQALMERNHPAYHRLITEELFAHHISLKKMRSETSEDAINLSLSEDLLQTFLKQLSFRLTAGQVKAWQEIRHDLTQSKPMMRLLQGDVGCGKTVVAALAALAAVGKGVQVAIMVPTEILAEQYYQQFNSWFTALGYRCDLLISKLKAKAKRSLLENVTLGISQIVIGTHALFQESVMFNALGLIIIDEQHRFGVHQRLTLQLKGNHAVHQLIMTATPIPRTLHMSHYAHVDISTIACLPPGRQPVTTVVIPQSKRSDVIAKIKNVCKEKHQIFWICTLIQESEVLDCQAAEKAAEALHHALLPYTVGLVHGQMESEEKAAVMQAFYEGNIDVLVATTVIEVGVNVPNATLMVIENPERLGLAQLHQLRGRVGRGSQPSFCILLYQSPLSEMAKSRLQILKETCDGFKIAQADLTLRGPGEILGLKQTGAVSLKIADWQRDRALMENVANWAEALSQTLSPEQMDRIIAKWGIGKEYAKA